MLKIYLMSDVSYIKYLCIKVSFLYMTILVYLNYIPLSTCGFIKI